MRLSSIRIVTGVSCLLFGAAAWHLGPRSSSDFAAQAQTPQAATATAAQQAPQLQPVSASIPDSSKLAPPIAALGSEIYTAKRGEAIPTIARRYLGRTSYLTSSELADAIREVNKKSAGSNILKANEQLTIPGILSAAIIEKTIPVAKDFEARAIYLTGIMAASDHGLRIIRHWREVGGNAVVFDIKDSDGSVTIPYEHPLLGKHQVYIHDVPKLVHFIHQQNMHAIARIAIFRDEHLVPNIQSWRFNRARTKQRGAKTASWSGPIHQLQSSGLRHRPGQIRRRAGCRRNPIRLRKIPAEGDQKDAAFVFQNESTLAAAQQDSSRGCHACRRREP